MGKNILMALVAFTLLGGIYNAITERGLSETHERFVKHQYEAEVRNIALAGFQQATQGLSDSFSSTSYEGTYESGSYQVRVTVTGDRAEIESYGTAEDSYGDPVRHTILATVARITENDSFSPVPAFMDYALLSEGNLTLNGNAGTATINVGSPQGDTLNASMHTNGDLTVNGRGNKQINGFGTYAGSAFGVHRDTKFESNYNPNGSPHTFSASSVDIPAFNATEYADNVTIDQTTTGNVSVSSDLDFGGTREDPYIWQIQGNMSFSGNTSISGYVIFIVEGDISFSGNTTVGVSGYADGDESSLAFYAGGAVTLTGNAEVWGQIFAEGDVTLQGSAELYGSITTRTNAILHGNPSIYYRLASPALTTNWTGGSEEQFRFVDYSEW